MLVRISREWIGSHADKLGVFATMAGDSVPRDPTQVLANFIQDVPHDTDFIGEPMYGISESFDMLRAC